MYLFRKVIKIETKTKQTIKCNYLKLKTHIN